MMKKLFHHKNASTYGDKSVKNRKKPIQRSINQANKTGKFENIGTRKGGVWELRNGGRGSSG